MRRELFTYLPAGDPSLGNSPSFISNQINSANNYQGSKSLKQRSRFLSNYYAYKKNHHRRNVKNRRGCYGTKSINEKIIYDIDPLESRKAERGEQKLGAVVQKRTSQEARCPFRSGLILNNLNFLDVFGFRSFGCFFSLKAHPLAF